MSTLATPANMRRFENEHAGHDGVAPDGTLYHVEAERCFAYSPNTGEEYSATSGDYWNLPADQPLIDSEGEPMILVTRRSSVQDIEFTS